MLLSTSPTPEPFLTRRPVASKVCGLRRSRSGPRPLLNHLWPHSSAQVVHQLFFGRKLPLVKTQLQDHVDCLPTYIRSSERTLVINHIRVHVIGPWTLLNRPSPCALRPFFLVFFFWPTMTPSPDSSTGPKSPELHSLEPPDGRIAHTLTACTRCRQV